MKDNNNITSLEQPIENMVDNVIDLTAEQARVLRNLGLKWIQNDDDALIDYAVNKLLFEISQDIEKRNNLIKKVLAKEAQEGKL
jgi:hypothetical protein